MSPVAAFKRVFCTEERKLNRTPATGEFRYFDDTDESGVANWCTVSKDGACISINRYLRPGRGLVIVGEGATLHGRIVWCRSIDGSKSFVAGVRILKGPQTETSKRKTSPAAKALLGTHYSR